MSLRGNIDVQGEDARKFIDMEPGTVITKELKIVFNMFTHDEFGDHASFTISDNQGEDSDSDLSETASVIEHINSLPGIG